MNKFTAAVKKVGNDKTNVPNMPNRYLWDTEDGPSVTHIDVRAFKRHWDESVEHASFIVKSRNEGVNYTRKEELRRRLMNFVVLNKIVVAVSKVKAGSGAEKQRKEHATSASMGDDDEEDEEGEGGEDDEEKHRDANVTE